MNQQRRSWERYLPGVATLRHYERRWLRGDLVSGLTVAAYLVPQVMAYAIIVGVPTVVGLWAILLPLAIYAVLGASRQLSVGPEASTALMTAAGIGALMGAAGQDRASEVAAIFAIAVGIVCLLGWVLRLGFLAALLSRPILVGYMAGIGILMVITQLSTITNLELEGGHPAQKVGSLLTQIGDTHLPTLAFSLVLLALLFLAERFLRRAPGPLIVLGLGAMAVAMFELRRFGLETLGEVPGGLPMPRLPALDDVSVWALLPFAVGIAVVGYSSNVITGRAFASKRHESIDASQELLALGAANVATGLFQGFPVSSSSSRTAVGDAAGSHTQLHSLVALLCVVAVLLFAAPALATFPMAGLGALVIYAATRLVDVAEIRRIARFRSSELILTFITAGAVLAFDILVGIGIAIGLSILDLVRRIATANSGVLGYVPGLAGMHDVTDYPKAVQVSGLVVFRYDSPLFFANAENFIKEAEHAVVTAEQPVYWFLLNAEANVQWDLTAVDTLQLLRKNLESIDITFAMARVKQGAVAELQPTGFVDDVGSDKIFATLPTAVRAYASWHEKRFGHPPEGVPESLRVY